MGFVLMLIQNVEINYVKKLGVLIGYLQEIINKSTLQSIVWYLTLTNPEI